VAFFLSKISVVATQKPRCMTNGQPIQNERLANIITGFEVLASAAFAPNNRSSSMYDAGSELCRTETSAIEQHIKV